MLLPVVLVIHGLVGQPRVGAQARPVQDCGAGFRLVEDAVNVGTRDKAILADGTVRFAIQFCRGGRQGRPGGDAVVHFVAGESCFLRADGERAGHVFQLLSGHHARGHVQ